MKRLDLPGEEKLGNLSKGMRAKLQLLIGLAHDSKLLLLDESTAGLDPDSRIELQEHIRKSISARNSCAIISSHLFEDIQSTATDVKIIREGRTVFHADLATFKEMRLYRLPKEFLPSLSTQFHSVLKPWQRKGDIFLLASKNDESQILKTCSLEQGRSKVEPVDLKRVYFLSERKSDR